MSAPVDVLAVMDGAEGILNAPAVIKAAELRRQQESLREARAAVAELIADVTPIIESLKSRIDADNAMTLQAVMVRRAAASLARCGG